MLIGTHQLLFDLWTIISATINASNLGTVLNIALHVQLGQGAMALVLLAHSAVRVCTNRPTYSRWWHN